MQANPEPDHAKATTPVRVRVAHAIAGRVRLRVADRQDADAMARLVDRIAEAGARRVIGRPNTGSLIVESDGEDHEAVLARLVEAGVIKVVPKPAPMPIRQSAQFGFMWADHEIGKRTEGALDFRTALALVYLAAALFQLTRGQVLGPTTTLLIAALSLLETGPRKG